MVRQCDGVVRVHKILTGGLGCNTVRFFLCYERKPVRTRAEARGHASEPVYQHHHTVFGGFHVTIDTRCRLPNDCCSPTVLAPCTGAGAEGGAGEDSGGPTDLGAHHDLRVLCCAQDPGGPPGAHSRHRAGPPPPLFLSGAHLFAGLLCVGSSHNCCAFSLALAGQLRFCCVLSNSRDHARSSSDTTSRSQIQRGEMCRTSSSRRS